jgi:hypothetical protein
MAMAGLLPTSSSTSARVRGRPFFLVEDLVAPLRLDESPRRDPHQQIPQRRRVPNAGVMDDRERHDQ